MICPKCNQSNQEGSIFCIKCGNSLLVEQTNVIQPMNPVVEKKEEPLTNESVYNPSTTVITPKEGLNNTQKIIIVALLVLLVGVLLFVILNKKSDTVTKVKKDPTRTIMIYLDGSNLESDSHIVTAELNAIDPSTIDLEHVNILLYTGGTKRWHNFIKNDENAIYKLGSEGFEKLEAYPQDSMGNPDNLTKLLEYGYTNYPAGHYNLMLYDHGGAIDGAIYDDFTGDNLSLTDLEMALSNSPFNQDKKLDSVIFRTCLNGTLEVSKMFNKYAEYITFSEEVTLGGPFTNVLGYFLNGISPDKEGDELGKDFIEAYKKQIGDLRLTDAEKTTYSIVDLSKIDNVVNKLNEFISSVDVNSNYDKIAKMRSSVYQYGTDALGYDTVDLYNFIASLAPYSTTPTEDLLNSIKEAVVYNYTDIKGSNGISIYFPYKGGKAYRKKFLEVYNKLPFLDNYKSFITTFESKRSGNQSYNFEKQGIKLSTDFKPSDNPDSKDVVLELTDEQAEHYNGVVYNILRRVPEHPNYYQWIYSSNDVDVIDNKYVRTKFDGNLVKMGDADNKIYLTIYDRVNGGEKNTKISTVLYDKTKEFMDVGYMVAADVKIINKENKPTFTSVKLLSRDDRVASVVYNINDFSYIEYAKSTYKIFDNNGEFIKYDDWEKSPEMVGIGADLKDVQLEYTGLDDGEFYIYFAIYDENNEYTVSDLMRIGV